MFRTIRPATRARIAMGLAVLCQLLDEMPSLGLGQADGIGGPSEEEAADEVLVAAGPVVVYRRGAWASRLTTLPLLAAGLDDEAAGIWVPRTGAGAAALRSRGSSA